MQVRSTPVESTGWSSWVAGTSAIRSCRYVAALLGNAGPALILRTPTYLCMYVPALVISSLN